MQKWIDKADVLLEALPYIQRLANKTIVIKYGGHAFNDEDLKSSFVRDVILLRFFGEASLAEMASVLGCSVGTVKSRLHHALGKLRKKKLNLSGLSWDTGI